MTDRKVTCSACKSAITEGDIANKDLEFGGEIKATDQPTYAADADTDLVATIGTLDEYTPMVRTSGNQSIFGTKSFSSIKTPSIEIENNFRPVVYYGDYDASDVQTAKRIRPITVFASPESLTNPILRMETLDDDTITGVELTVTLYNDGTNRSIAIYANKSDGMAYVTAPSRGSTTASDYNSNEVVTIDTLRKLGLIS